MSCNQQVKDILEFGRKMHASTQECYASLEQKTDQERIRMLLNYLGRHERKMEENLARFSAESRQKILDAWITHVPQTQIDALLGRCMVLRGASVEEVVRMGIEFDDALIDLYREVAREATLPDVRQVFLDLIDQENQERLRLLQSVNQLREM
jgi:rubrerythrin